MSKVDLLLKCFEKHIAVPWSDGLAPAQRVIFCVYNENDELRLRAKIAEFELATRQTGHDWFMFDLTDTFAIWLAGQKYAESYFRKPELLAMLLPKYLDSITEQFAGFLDQNPVDDRSVVALQGVGSLFGLRRVKAVVGRLAPMAQGRLVVFFPGTFENNNFRLLDAHDGWDYLAVPITADCAV